MVYLHLSTLLVVITYVSSNVVPTKSPGTFELLILHNNDMHARFEQTSQLSGTCTMADRDAGKCYGGFPRVAYVVKQAREAAKNGSGPPVLYLNAGDTYTGTPWFTIYKWKIAAEFVNALNPDAVSLGNHEFDNGVSGLTPFIENLSCPVLAANLVLKNVPELEREDNLKKSIVIDVDGIFIGIVGYLTPETKVLAKQNNVDYIDEILALKEEVNKLQDAGIKIIIALGHSGYSKDLEIAKQVKGIDLVIGGHTNTFLWNGTSPDSELINGPYPTYVRQRSGKLVPVVQAYAYTKYLGKLLIKFDSNGEIVNINGEPILLDHTVPQDPEVMKIVNKYKHDISNDAEVILGNTSVTLDGITCLRRECNLGNLITDAMIYRYLSNFKGDYWTDVPIALIQGGGIRASISHVDLPSPVTKGDLLTVMPFEGDLVVVTINGSTLLKVLEHSVGNYESIDDVGKFLQVAGIRVTYDVSKRRGHRVVNALVRCSQCDVPSYNRIETEASYKIIMPGFLASGGDGYKMLSNLPKQKLTYSELDCTEFYIRYHNLIYTGIEGRSTILGYKKVTRNSAVTALSYSNFLLIIFLWLSLLR